MYQVPERIQNQLQEGEKILWSGGPSLSVFERTVIKHAMFVFLFSCTIIYQLGGGIGMYAGFLFVFAIGLFAVVTYRLRLRKRHYLVSNQRIAIFFEKHVQNIPYHEIYKIERIISSKRIVLFNKPNIYSSNNSTVDFPQLEGLTNVVAIYDIIKKAYEGNGPFSQIQKKVQKLGEEHGLTLGAHKGKLSLVGQVDGLPFSLIVTGKAPVKRLSISFTCPNPRDIFLYVIRESILDNVVKFLGTQDIQVGNPTFDAAFLLQSNDPDFLKEVMKPEVQNLLIQANNLSNGHYLFGDRRALKKDDKSPRLKDHGDVLDLHLLERDAKTLPGLRMVPSNHKSPLTYICDFNATKGANTKTVGLTILVAFDAMRALAKAVGHANKGKV